MLSRYDFMVEGKVADTDNSYFPDPLSLNYVAFTPTEAMEPVDLTVDGIKKFWWVVQNIYGEEATFLDDVVLTLNGVIHKNHLHPGQILFVPKRKDIEDSFTRDE